MLKSTKVYFAALVAVSAISFTSQQPASAQLDPEPSDMEEIDVVLNAPELGPPGPGGPDFMPPPPPGGGIEGGVAFTMPMPPPGMDVMAMRRGGPGGHRGGGCPLSCLSGENAVTDEQFEKMYNLKNSVMDQIGPKMLELHTAQRHLRDVLTQETIDEKAAKKLQSQIAAAKADIESVKMDAKLTVMQTLTGAQRKELRKAMMKGGFGGGGGRCGPGPGGPGGHHMMFKRFSEKKEESH